MDKLTGQIINVLDTPNKNGHVYTAEDFNEAIEKNKTQPIFGTLGMPYDYNNGGNLDPAQVSHKVTNLRIEDGKVLGDIEIIGTPKGIILKNMLNSGVKLDYRTCGIGQINSNGNISEFKLISINAVQNGA